MNKVTVSHSITIAAEPETVWDYTQDWNRRSRWDRSVVAASYVDAKTVRVKGQGGLNFIATYKVSERPRLTTLAMNELNSFWVKGGGGSWKYEAQGGATLWTQNNTLILREGLIGRLFLPIFGLILRITTRQMMARAAAQITRGN